MMKVGDTVRIKSYTASQYAAALGSPGEHPEHAIGLTGTVVEVDPATESVDVKSPAGWWWYWIGDIEPVLTH
jgi:hypothetical protein